MVTKTNTSVDDLIWNIINNSKNIFLLILSIYIGSKFLKLPQNVNQIMNVIMIITLWLQVGIWAAAAFKFWFMERNIDQADGRQKTNLSIINTIVKIFIWSVILILVLDSIPSIDITALIASLGIGGIAVGLAVQNILEDLFSSVTIALDKPFMIGDFISVGDFSGSVEHIGLKSTRLRSISGEQLVFSNSDLLNSRIQNYKRMERRRVAIKLGVTYQTTPNQLKTIPETIKKIVTSFELITYERANLTNFGNFSIDFEFSYYVESSDIQFHLDTQENILLQLYESFSQENIEFAYPTQTIFVEQETKV
jgi:small-conductance mechanosensitive channel